MGFVHVKSREFFGDSPFAPTEWIFRPNLGHCKGDENWMWTMNQCAPKNGDKISQCFTETSLSCIICRTTGGLASRETAEQRIGTYWQLFFRFNWKLRHHKAQHGTGTSISILWSDLSEMIEMLMIGSWSGIKKSVSEFIEKSQEQQLEMEIRMLEEQLLDEWDCFIHRWKFVISLSREIWQWKWGSLFFFGIPPQSPNGVRDTTRIMTSAGLMH